MKMPPTWPIMYAKPKAINLMKTYETSKYMKERYSFQVQTDGRDTYPNNFKCWVMVEDKKNQIKFKRRGYGKFIGNFSPIWITINKETKQLTEFERERIG